MRRLSAFSAFAVAALLFACAPPQPSVQPPRLDETEPAVMADLGLMADSLPEPIGPMAALVAASPAPDTVGYRTLTVADFNYRGDPGAGPVPLGTTWSGNLGVYKDPVAGMVARYTYPPGFAAGRSPGFVWSAGTTAAAQKVSNVYLRTVYRYSANFQNPSANVSKTFLLGFGPNGNQLILGLTGKGMGTHTWWLAFQGLGNFATSASVGIYKHNILDCCAFAVIAAGSAMRRAQWDTVEVQVYSGAPGTRTTRARVWINQRLSIDVTGFDIVKPGVSPALYYEKWAPVWGGGGAPAAQLMTLDMDRVYVSGAP